jgi:hypothetical protein
MHLMALGNDHSPGRAKRLHEGIPWAIAWQGIKVPSTWRGRDSHFVEAKELMALMRTPRRCTPPLNLLTSANLDLFRHAVPPLL